MGISQRRLGACSGTEGFFRVGVTRAVLSAHWSGASCFRNPGRGLLASAIAENSVVSCKGFNRKAMAPADSQRSRTPISPCAVMTMVGIWMPLARQMLMKLQAAHLRHLQVDDQTFGQPVRQRREKFLALSHMSLHGMRGRAAAGVKAFSTDGSSSTMAIQAGASAMRRLLRLRSATRRVGRWANTRRMRHRYAHFEMPAFSAMRTRSATVRTPSFSIIRLRWTLMVFSTVPRSPAICLLSRPATTCVSTSRSRGVKVTIFAWIDANSASNLPRLGILLFGARDGRQQVLVADRLGQEIDGARLHGAHARRNVALAGDENDRPVRSLGRQRLLQLEAVETGHGDVQYGATGNRRIVLCKEFLRRRVRPDIVALRAQQPRQRLEHPGVVIDDEDREHPVRHWAAMSIS